MGVGESNGGSPAPDTARPRRGGSPGQGALGRRERTQRTGSGKSSYNHALSGAIPAAARGRALPAPATGERGGDPTPTQVRYGQRGRSRQDGHTRPGSRT